MHAFNKFLAVSPTVYSLPRQAMLSLVLIPLPLGNLNLRVRLFQGLVPLPWQLISVHLPQPSPPALQEGHEVTVQERYHKGLQGKPG